MIDTGKLNNLIKEEPNIEFKSGMSFNAKVPFAQPFSIKVHIDHVLPTVYDNEFLIVYRCFGKHKKWWHYFICRPDEMAMYKQWAEEEKTKSKKHGK